MCGRGAMLFCSPVLYVRDVRATPKFMHGEVGRLSGSRLNPKIFGAVCARKQERSSLKNVARRLSRYEPLSVAWQGEVPSRKPEAPAGPLTRRAPSATCRRIRSAIAVPFLPKRKIDLLAINGPPFAKEPAP